MFSVVSIIWITILPWNGYSRVSQHWKDQVGRKKCYIFIYKEILYQTVSHEQLNRESFLKSSEQAIVQRTTHKNYNNPPSHSFSPLLLILLCLNPAVFINSGNLYPIQSYDLIKPFPWSATKMKNFCRNPFAEAPQ